MNFKSQLNKRSLFYILILLGVVAYLIVGDGGSIFGNKEFTIEISKTESKIKLTCSKGCDWKELTFPNNKSEKRFIDETGMYINTKEGEDNTNFIFKISTKVNSIKMKGMKGTAWTQMQFRLNANNSEIVNQDGFVNDF